MAGDRPPMPVRIESPSGARPEFFLGKSAGTESFEPSSIQIGAAAPRAWMAIKSWVVSCLVPQDGVSIDFHTPV